MLKIQKHVDTGWINLTSICKYRRVNGIVYICIYNHGDVKLDKGDNRIAVIPEGFRPAYEIILPVQLMGVGATLNSQIHSRIQINGEINTYLPIETFYIGGFVSYPVD